MPCRAAQRLPGAQRASPAPTSICPGMVLQVLQNQASNGKIDRHDQAAIAYYHQEQDPSMPTTPGCAGRSTTGRRTATAPHTSDTESIPDPGPLPAASGWPDFCRGHDARWTRGPQPQAPQPLEPGAVRQRPEQARGPMRVPTAHATQLGGGSPPVNSPGNITPIILPRSLCWLRKRPSISFTRFSGKPRSCRACSRASMARWPGADHAPGVHARGGDGAVWVWLAFWRIVCWGT